MSTDDDRRTRGIAQMKAVYGWDVGEVQGAFLEQTIDHLFGEVWARPGMAQRDRRLLIIGMLAAAGLVDVLEIQLDAALRLGELTTDDLEDIVLFVAHYAGWPTGAKVNQLAMDLATRHDPTR
jgi:4-carboxymuconolactone decarboxylase